jgi:acyl-coenzyme A thioesterase PaaI-like protein
MATDLDDPTLPERERVAAALRRLGHAIVGHQIAPDVLDRITAEVETWLPALEAGERRHRDPGYLKRRMFEEPVLDGEVMDHFSDCVVSGAANPMGIGIQLRREGDDAVALVHLGPAFEGAPERAHGGIVAAVFDDVMGLVLKMTSTPAFTGELTIRYVAPTPVGVDLEFRARLLRREDRKLWMEAEATHLGQVVATASALFIAIPPERLGLPHEVPAP